MKKWCWCDWPDEELRKDGYFCKKCNLAIECEMWDYDDDGVVHQATIKHIHYLVCEKHEDIAIWAVYDQSHNY